MILSLSLFLTLLPSSTKGNVPNVKKNCWALVSDTVHTGVKVCKIDLLNNLGFSLCAILPVCYMVETSDNRKKSKMRVSADLVCHCWILEIEFNKSLSSLIIRLANYSVTTSYIWVLTIEDAWSFSGIAPITLSGGFSIETLTGVTLLWKTEYLYSCITTTRYVMRKMATIEDMLV